MNICILKPGLLSTIQDMGRRYFLSQGVPFSGALDTLSARIANKAVGNSDDEAVCEFTYADAQFKAETDILIAYAGDGAKLISGEQKLPAERPLFILSGSIIELVNNSAGSRTYLSIAGGWNVPDVMGSKSTYITAAFGGIEGRHFRAGDILNSADPLTDISGNILNRLKGAQINYPEWSIPRQLLLPSERKNIRVAPGPEFGWFDSSSVVDFLTTPYTLSRQSNRMGYHLEGAVIRRTKTEELLSTAVVPGTLQVTGGGSMVLLMADCQTTGGYPRIAQVAAVDLPLCGQLKPGDVINFTEISRQDAEKLYLEREQQLHRLSIAVKNRYL